MRPWLPNVRQVAVIGLLALVGLSAAWAVSETSFAMRWIGGISTISLLVSGLVCWKWRSPPDVIGIIERIAPHLKRVNVWVWALAAIVAGWLVGGVWLQGFPIADDVYAMQMQAQTFALGKLTVPAPPVPEAFSHPRFAARHGVWISQYPPGWALLLTPFAHLDLPLWLAPSLLSAGSLILFWKIARRRLEFPLAVFAMVALAGSAFFVLNASTLYSHAPATFFGLAAVEAVLRRREGGRWLWLLLAGAMLGAMGLIRPFNATLFITALGGALLADWLRARRWQDLTALAAFGLGGVPFALVLLAYQDAITGSPFTTIPAWLGQPEPLGKFSSDTLYFTLHRICSLMLTTSPLLAAAGVVAPVVLWVKRRFDFPDLLFPLTAAALLLYSGGGGIEQSYGPRYLFEALPYLVLSLAVATSVLGVRKRFVRAVIAAHLIIQTAGLAGWLVFERAVVVALAEPFRLVRQAELQNALVILESCPKTYRKCYASDMTRNGLDVTAPPVLFAFGRRVEGAKLRAAFPDREFWIYRDGELKPLDANAR